MFIPERTFVCRICEIMERSQQIYVKFHDDIFKIVTSILFTSGRKDMLISTQEVFLMKGYTWKLVISNYLCMLQTSAPTYEYESKGKNHKQKSS